MISPQPHRCIASVLLALAVTLIPIPAAACRPDPPLMQEPGESDASFELRRKQAEAEAAKTPEQRELEFQARLWEESEMVFVGQVVRVKLDGKIYPRLQKPKPKSSRKGRILPPVPIEPPLFMPYGEGHEAFIRSLRMLKGSATIKPSWHYVGGITSCGGTNDGSLGSVYPGETVIIFGGWGERVDGRNVVTKYLDMHGLTPDEIAEPRLKAAIDAGNPLTVQ